MLILYTKNGCPWCDEVRDFLMENKIHFEEREVRLNEEYFKEMMDKSGQTKAPTIDLDGEIFSDLGKEEVEEILKDKGII
jgi:glutaredoxin 3